MLLSQTGSQPLNEWQSKHTVREYSSELKGLVFRMERHSELLMRRKIKEQFVVFQVKVEDSLHVEISYSDHSGKGKLWMSSQVKQIKLDPLHVTLPMKLSKGRWINLIVDVKSLVMLTGKEWKETLSIQISGVCWLRKVFCVTEKPCLSGGSRPSVFGRNLEIPGDSEYVIMEYCKGTGVMMSDLTCMNEPVDVKPTSETDQKRKKPLLPRVVKPSKKTIVSKLNVRETAKPNLPVDVTKAASTKELKLKPTPAATPQVETTVEEPISGGQETVAIKSKDVTSPPDDLTKLDDVADSSASVQETGHSQASETRASNTPDSIHQELPPTVRAYDPTTYQEEDDSDDSDFHETNELLSQAQELLNNLLFH